MEGCVKAIVGDSGPSTTRRQALLYNPSLKLLNFTRRPGWRCSSCCCDLVLRRVPFNQDHKMVTWTITGLPSCQVLVMCLVVR